MALQFPMKHANGNLPCVVFSPFEYDFPAPKLLEFTKPNKNRSKNAKDVRLYLPADFNETINASWGIEDTFQGSTGSVFTTMIGNVAKAVGNRDAKLVASTEQGVGKVPYPTDTQIFKAVEPATLNFSFNMIPFDKAEGDAIVNIIKNFKTNILPRATTDLKNVVLKFPDIWDITFVNINGIGLEKDKVYESMCLIGCNVTYVSGTENMTVYNDNNPTQVRLNLTFQALRKQFLLN